MIKQHRLFAWAISLLATSSIVVAAQESSTSSSTIGSIVSQGLSERATEAITDQIRLKLEETYTEGTSMEETLRALQAATEDFDEFRELFRKATVFIPDFETSQTILFADLIVRASNIKCFDIVLGDMQITYGLVSSQRLDFQVDINDLDLFCTLDYEWDYSFFNGAGVARITLDNNYASTTVVFESPDFQSLPPESSRVETCSAIITITDMDFSGSFTDQVLNVFESLLRGYVEDAVQGTVCTELDSLGTTLVQDMLVSASEMIQPYLLPLEAYETNATIAESLLVVPPEVKLMDFQDEGDEQTWFYRALKEVDQALGVWLIDPNTDRPNGKDLGVNIFLRENILDENRALELRVEDLPLEFDPVLFQGHDELTESTLTMTAVRIYGLDTFSNFAPFINRGKYTLQNDLSWDFLSFELDVTIDMKPSTREDSIIEGTNDEDIHIVEEVTMKFGVDDINATLSVLLAIDEDAFGMLRMGPLFYEENILPCFWSSVFKSEVTVLSATAGNIQEPAMEGFISAGIDHVVTQSVKAAFTMYEGVVLRAMPNIFQLAFKDTLNEAFFTSYNGVCPPVKQTEGYIDFRDLLLPAEEAPALGGSGEEPYGDMAATLFGFLKTQIATVEADGTLSANSMFIRGFTEAQSGIEGEIHLDGELFGLSAADFDWAGFDVLLDGFKMSLSDVRAGNLDTLVPPFKVMEPTAEADVLDNELHLGPVSNRPLNVSAVFSIYFGQNSPFAMKNDIAVSMTSSAFEILAEVIARVEAMKLLNFPIRDLLQLQCWLATVPAPALDEVGLRINPNEERGIGLSKFSNKFQDLNVVVECANCTTSGLDMLPTILDLMRETDVTRVLASRMKFMVQDAVVSDSFQTFLDRMLNEASMKCPHSSDFTTDVDSIGTNYHDLPLPALSELSIDTAEFLIATMVQIAFVVFTQLYAETEVNPADALVEQQAFTIPENSNLLNFSDMQLNLPEFVDSALDEVMRMITGTRVDPLTGQEDLAVNIFMRDLFSSNGVIALELEDMSFGGDDLKVEFHSFRIEGLDTFKKFSVGVPVADQTLLNDIAMGKLAIEADFGIRSGDAAQRIKLSFQFDDLSASIPLFAAIDKDLLMSLQIGSLLRIPKLIPCFFSAVYGFSLPHLVVNVGKIHKPSVVGLMPETDASLKALVDTLFSRYSEAMHESLPSVFDNAIRPILNRLFAFYIKQNGSDCNNPIVESLASATRKLMQAAGPPFVDFRDLLLSEAASKLLGGRGDSRYGDLIRSVWGLIEDELLKVNPSGNSPINGEVIAPLTESISSSPGDLFFPGEFFNQDTKVNLGPVPTGITLRFSDIRIENLDSIGSPFSLLDPVQDRPSLVNNTATAGATKPLRFGMRVLVGVSSDGESIRNDFEISANFHAVTLVLAALLKVSEYRFAAFPIGDIFELDCWLATLPPPALDKYGVRHDSVDPSAAMEQLVLTMKKLDANITCTDCSSPGFQELADLWSTPEAAEEMTEAANNLLEYLSELLGDGLIQNQIDRMLNDAAKRCPHSPEYQRGFDAATYRGFKIETEEESISLAILVMIVTGCLIACLGVLVFIIRFIVRRRHRRWLKTLPNSQLMLIKQRQEREEEKEAELNAMTQSMFTSKNIPLLVRLFIPLIIIGNIGFFLSGHLSLGAEVKIIIKVAGEVLRIEQFYQFSLARSTVEIWQAGGKELAALILIFSGIWPYTKQLISLALWFLPPSWCSISRRGSIFLWLDTLAKWSIVDIFTLVVSIAAFRLSVTNPKVGFLTEDLYAFDILVVPMWGLYANLIAQLISQISSHFIIHYHRNIVHQATKAYRRKHGLVVASQVDLALAESSDRSEDSDSDNPYGDMKDVLYQHAYSRPHRGETGKVITRGYVNGLVVFVALAFSVLMIVGCVLPSSGLEFLGLLGVAVESGQNWEQAYAKLSLFDLSKLLMNQARFTGGAKAYAGLGLLCSLLVITVLLVPLAQTAVLMYQWFTPMDGRTRSRASIAVEILQAWQYAEVYVISVVVATWQLGPISTFMINGYCRSFQETFNVLAYFGILAEDDAQCFRVDAKIESGSYILLLAAALLALLNTFVMNAVKQYFRDRDDVISRSEMKERMLNQLEGAQTAEGIEKEEGILSEEASASEYWEGREDAENYIKPVPVLFTDKFRWLLRGATEAEELNGRAPLPPIGELTEKPQAASEPSTSDDEQPTSPLRSVKPTSESSIMVAGDEATI